MRDEGLGARQGLLALLRQHGSHVSSHQAAAHMPPQRSQPRTCALLHVHAEMLPRCAAAAASYLLTRILGQQSWHSRLTHRGQDWTALNKRPEVPSPVFMKSRHQHWSHWSQGLPPLSIRLLVNTQVSLCALCGLKHKLDKQVSRFYLQKVLTAASPSARTCAGSAGSRKVLSGVMKEGDSSRCRGVTAKVPDP